jgi:hypothetical protein
MSLMEKTEIGGSRFRVSTAIEWVIRTTKSGSSHELRVFEYIRNETGEEPSCSFIC